MLSRIHSPTNWKVIGAGSSPGAGPAMSCGHSLTRIRKSIALNTGSWTGWTVRSWSWNQDQSGTRCRKWCIAHHELVDCLRFVIISGSVPAGDASVEGTVVTGVRSALHRRQARFVFLLVSMVQESPHGKFVWKKNKKRFDK